MKNFYFIIGGMLLVFNPIQAQKVMDKLHRLIDNEKRQAEYHLNYKANPNTVNYDLTYHRLEFTVDPSNTQEYIAGKVTSYWIAKENMNSITFDMVNSLNVISVKQRGDNLTYTHNNNEITITLPQTQNTNVLDSLTIEYAGNPATSGFNSFVRTLHQGVPVIWTLSEPYGARDWWPCKQDLTDKIDSIDTYITYPAVINGQDFKAASNGLLISETVQNGQKTSHWHHGHPIPAYLIAIAVTNYTVYNDYAYQGTESEFPITNYVYPEDLSVAQSGTPITADYIELYGDLFEMYPYADEKYGHAQFGWGGGMEHTTMTFMGGFSNGLIAHELAHQWFGDKVTCGSWRDIWLNEGFATYLTGLTKEHLESESAFETWRVNKINSITSLPDGSVYCTDTTNTWRIFSGRLSYDKGSMVLHMLRYKLGDEDFFQGLRNYLADPELSYGYARTTDLQQHLEDQSGLDLEEFFNDWFMGEGYPSYQIHWNQTGNNVQIKINQTQSHPSVSYFEMPVPVKLIGSGGNALTLRLENTFDGQIFNETVNFTINQVIFDPESHLISKNNSVTIGATEADKPRIEPLPNPVSGKILIQTVAGVEFEGISIYNEMGQKIREQDAAHPEVNFETLPSGLLLLRIHTDKGELSKKLINQ